MKAESFLILKGRQVEPKKKKKRLLPAFTSFFFLFPVVAFVEV